MCIKFEKATTNEKGHLEGIAHRKDDNIKMNIYKLDDSVDWIHLAQIQNVEIKLWVSDRRISAQSSHSVKTDSNSFEGVEEFKYLGTTLTNQNCIQVEVKSRLKLGNAC